MRSQVIRRSGLLSVLVTCSMILPVGCSEPAVEQSSLPPPEFAAKLEKEHPELFIKKIGKGKTEKLDGRDKRAIIRQEWFKTQQ